MRLIRAPTDINDRTTIVFVDGIGAYDSISRDCMLERPHRIVDGDQMIPFVRLFCGSLSVSLWEDDVETRMNSCKEKVESKAIHSCLSCSVSGNTAHCWQLMQS